MGQSAYTAAQKRAAVALAAEVGPKRAALALGLRQGLVRHWTYLARRGELTFPEPSWPALPTEIACAAPGIPELRARWTQRGSYEPADPLTGRQLLARIWPDRTAAA